MGIFNKLFKKAVDSNEKLNSLKSATALNDYRLVSGQFYKDGTISLYDVLFSFSKRPGLDNIAIIYVGCYSETYDFKIGSTNSFKQLLERMSKLGFLQPYNHALKENVFFGFVFLSKAELKSLTSKGKPKKLWIHTEKSFTSSKSYLYDDRNFALSRLSPIGTIEAESEWFSLKKNAELNYDDALQDIMRKLVNFSRDKVDKINLEEEADYRVFTEIV